MTRVSWLVVGQDPKSQSCDSDASMLVSYQAIRAGSEDCTCPDSLVLTRHSLLHKYTRNIRPETKESIRFWSLWEALMKCRGYRWTENDWL